MRFFYFLFFLSDPKVQFSSSLNHTAHKPHVLWICPSRVTECSAACPGPLLALRWSKKQTRHTVRSSQCSCQKLDDHIVLLCSLLLFLPPHFCLLLSSLSSPRPIQLSFLYFKRCQVSLTYFFPPSSASLRFPWILISFTESLGPKQ